MLKTRRTAAVVANGTLPNPEIVRRELAAADFVLAADGGANRLAVLGLLPDAVIGDFDSIIVELPASVKRVPTPDQNHTDLEKAVRFLRKEGYDEITLLGATGDRLDHTFGALAIVCKYSVRLVDDIGVATSLRGPEQKRFPTRPGQTVSLMPCGKVSGLRTTNLNWNLHDDEFDFAERDGTSNTATAESVEVSIANGYLIVYTHHLSE